jgi:hypothetical protein
MKHEADRGQNPIAIQRESLLESLVLTSDLSLYTKVTFEVAQALTFNWRDEVRYDTRMHTLQELRAVPD